MKAEDARATIRAENLIDRRTSQAILSCIVRDEPLPETLSPDLAERIAELRQTYRAARAAGRPGEPRNMPFYRMIKARRSDFAWRETANGTVIDFTYKGLKPSLLSLLVDRVPEPKRSPCCGCGKGCGSAGAIAAGLPKEVADRLAALERDLGIVVPNPVHRARFRAWIAKGLAGEPLTIVSPVCPDYAVEPIAPVETRDAPEKGGEGAGARAITPRHRFTFDGVGTGIGVTAAHLFTALPRFHAALAEILPLPVRHLVCPGDFEGFSEETLARLGLDATTFTARLEASARAIERESPVRVEARLFTRLGNGRPDWDARYGKTLRRLLSGDLADLAHDAAFRRVALGRRGLYDRWYAAEGREDDFYVGIALRQAAEYAVMGAMVAESPDTPNPLVFGADDHKMGRFYDLTASVPVIYLQRNYE